MVTDVEKEKNISPFLCQKWNTTKKEKVPLDKSKKIYKDNLLFIF